MSSFEKFNKNLPDKNKFYSCLISKRMSYENHEHVFKVLNKFEIKPMKEYHDSEL